VLSTKIGYGIPGIEDWTPASITAGVDAALERLRTDCIDVVHLHSCPLEVLRRPGLIEALLAARSAGKVRAAAYSGEGEALEWAVRSGAFEVVQCSVSVVDQGSLAIVAEAHGRGVGVIAKRALGNTPWRFAARPGAPDIAEAWERFHALKLLPRSYAAVFARFAAFAPGVSSALVGTASPMHLSEACAAVAQGPLEVEVVAELRRSFDAVGNDWAPRI
jgi:aryl-alcohol dehydrogenase-like predicted oxidoreductase